MRIHTWKYIYIGIYLKSTYRRKNRNAGFKKGPNMEEQIPIFIYIYMLMHIYIYWTLPLYNGTFFYPVIRFFLLYMDFIYIPIYIFTGSNIYLEKCCTEIDSFKLVEFIISYPRKMAPFKKPGISRKEQTARYPYQNTGGSGCVNPRGYA